MQIQIKSGQSTLLLPPTVSEREADTGLHIVLFRRSLQVLLVGAISFSYHVDCDRFDARHH